MQDLPLKVEGFQYALSLDSNMGYYHIKLCPFSRILCTIVLPLAKYEYQKLSMGLYNSPDIFLWRNKQLVTTIYVNMMSPSINKINKQKCTYTNNDKAVINHKRP